MKVLLVQPAKPRKAIGGEDIAVYEPLALEYVAAMIRDHHDVKILDMRLDDDLDAVLKVFRPDIVGVTAYTVHVNVVKDLFEKIKKYDPGIVTVVGGHHATIAPDDFFVDAVDCIVQGEGVFTFKEIMDRLGSKMNLSGIPGTAVRTNGTFKQYRGEAVFDLDSFPFPDRTLTAPYRNNYFSEWMKPLASIRTSKGCMFRCSFCALWKLTGGKYLTRKPENILEELGMIEEEFIFFADDESLLDTERMNKLAELIKRSGIKKRFFLYGRSDTIINHPGLLETWKEAGLERVFVGLEFFHDDHLKAVRKGSTAKNNIEAIRILQSLGIDIFPNFMVNPDFDKTDFREFKKYCRGLNLEFIGFSVLTPLPGTDLYEEVKDRMITRNFDYCDFFHTLLPTRLPMKEFYSEYMDLFKNTRSVTNQIAFLRKYPLKEWPSLFRFFHNFSGRIKGIHGDYADV